MKIGIVMDPFGESKPGGLGISIYKLTRTLIEYSSNNFKENSFQVFLKDATNKQVNIFGNFLIKNLNTKFLYFCNPFKFTRNTEKQDLYIFMMPTIPLFFFPKKSLVIIFDFAYLDIPSKNIISFFRKNIIYALHYISLKKATKLVSISKDAALSTEINFGIKSESISVCYLGYDDLNGEKKEIKLPEKFFLFAGVIKERKNVRNIVLAFNEFKKQEKIKGSGDYKLVAIGKHEGRYFQELQNLIKDLKLENEIFFKGFVTLEEKRFVYSKAESLIFASLAEGFGMPILEAFSVGLPVITSNYGSMKELAGEAGVLVDPTNLESIAGAFNNFATQKINREELIEKGLERVKQFSWEITTKKILENI